MLIVSLIFMVVAWTAAAGTLTFCLIQKFTSEDDGDWNTLELVMVGILALMLVFIPVQLVRYFREWRTLNLD